MTNEEALEILKSIEILSFRDIKRKYFMADVWKAKKVAIKALEQLPCEDCISREAVDNYIVKLMSGYLYDEERTRLEDLTAYIWELPSITPKGVTITDFADRCRECGKQKAGKWKRISPAGIYECTNCNQVIMTSDIDCYKYCHGCGVRMEGEE